MSRFQRHLIPPAQDYYEKQLGELGRPNRAGWCACRCPFHNSESGKSFAVHVDGAFVCRGCGVKGGGLPAFVMLRDNCDFKAAAKSLACWDEAGKPIKIRPGPLVPCLRMDFAIDGVEYHVEIPDEPTTELQRLRRLHADAHDRLTEMRNGNAEKFESEEEVRWGILATSWELIRLEVTSAR